MSNRLQLTQLAASIALVAGSAAFISSAYAAPAAVQISVTLHLQAILIAQETLKLYLQIL